MGDYRYKTFDLSTERRAFLDRLFAEHGLKAPPSEKILRRDKSCSIPLSFAQQRLWFLDHWAPRAAAYNIAGSFRIIGALNLTALRQAFNEIVRRHESLRTIFDLVEGQPVQVIAQKSLVSAPLVDLFVSSIQDQLSYASKLATDEARRMFDLSVGPLLRVSVLRLEEDHFICLLVMHHIVSDGWSVGVLTQEIAALYGAFCAGIPSPLSDLPIQYSDFALWQRERLHGEALQSSLDYWKRQLAGVATGLELPTDRPRPAVQTYQGARHAVRFDQSLTAALKTLSRSDGATLFMTLLAAFQVLLYRYTGQEDICVGSPIAGRTRPETETLIGCFVNTLVLRVVLERDTTFEELLAQVRTISLAAYAHADLPYERLVEELQPRRDLSHAPLFQVMFALHNTTTPKFSLTGLKVASEDVDNRAARFDLALSLIEIEGRLEGALEYSTNLFDRHTISRLLRHFNALLDGIAAEPHQRIVALPLLTTPESHHLLIEWNDTKFSYKDKHCVHQLFEMRVESAPDAIALSCGSQTVTYKELNRRSNQVGQYLSGMGVGPEVRVGLFVKRSVEWIVGMLGVMKAGGVFVPLDPALPIERLEFMLEDAQTPIVLTQEHLLSGLLTYRGEVICLDSEEAISRQPETGPACEVKAENAAYMIYTSGTTGRPKGVLVAQRGLYQLSQAQVKAFGVGPGDRALQFAQLSFDASVFEVMLALCVGATLCFESAEKTLPGEGLIKFIKEQGVNLVTLTPSALAVMPGEDLPGLKTINVAGEACSANLVTQWSRNRRFNNLYGPTEATVWATMAQCQEGEATPPIGRPIGNTEIFLLDANQRLAPIGVVGEVYIGGLGVSRGYLNEPGMTAERYVPQLWGGHPGARLYKTGDLARYRTDGQVEYVGRMDHQVKVRGYRVELGEIETVLSQHPAVQKAVVISRENSIGGKQLIAYVVCASNQQVDTQVLQPYVREKLPEYMVPSAFMFLERLPLTHNGKVDRLNLPALEGLSGRTSLVYIAPQTDLERRIAEVWQEVLQIEEVGLNDNFFDLGGHSLSLLSVHAKLGGVVSQGISVIELFKYPTVAAQAKHLSRALSESTSAERCPDRARSRQVSMKSQRDARRRRREERKLGKPSYE